MTDIVETGRPERRRPSRRTTWIVIALLVVALVVALPVAWHWWTHPDLLPDHSDSRSFWAPQPVHQAATAFLVMPAVAQGDPTSLTFHGASTLLAKNTARAKASFSVCDTAQQPDPDIRNWPVDQLIQVCSAQHALVDGTRLTYPDPHHLVLLTLTPTRPGVVRLTGVDVRYSLGLAHLFQHGTDHVGLDARLTAR
jgi:hypothetical protein